MARTVNKDQINPTRKNLPDWVHPEVLYWNDEWQLIRDTAAGERDVKDERQEYLPQLDSQDANEYEAYIQRATFYPFTGRTINALVGTIFYRDPVITGVPERLVERLKYFTKAGAAHLPLMKGVCQEVLSVGRVGVLIDLPRTPSTDPKPFVDMYIAENILDWETTIIDDPTHDMHGKSVLSKVVLREIDPVMVASMPGTLAKKHLIRYRELLLTVAPNPTTGIAKYTYVQKYYAQQEADANYPNDLVDTVIPTRRGEPLDFIPFFVFGPLWSSTEVEKPPMIDIAPLNISHYRSYAHLEHGRFYTGMPVYYVELSQGQESGEYTVGPSVVWETAPGSKPGILEFNGQGLKFLSDALKEKEAQAAALGGRMVGVQTGSTSESDNQVAVKDRNEQVILLNAVESLDEGFRRVMNVWLWWQNENDPNAAVEHNRDFLLNLAGAREMRAVAGMYADGLIPVEVLHDYLVKAEVVPAWMSLSEFEKQLKSASNFPGQPDAQARMEGYKDKGQMIMEALKEWELEIEEELAGIEDVNVRETVRANKAGERQAAIDSKVAAKQAEQNAKMKAQAAKAQAQRPAGATAAKPAAAKAVKAKAKAK